MQKAFYSPRWRTKVRRWEKKRQINKTNYAYTLFLAFYAPDCASGRQVADPYSFLFMFQRLYRQSKTAVSL